MNPHIEIGSVVGDGYRIEALEASTPSVNLFRATELRHRATVTVSVLHAHLAEDDDWWAEIERVAQARAKVKHANLVPLRRLIDRPRALVFDRFKGRGLEQIFKAERGTRPAQDATTTLLPVADALEQAHRRAGLLHGKLTPTSIVVQQFGSVQVPVLVDLGFDTNLVRQVAAAAAYRDWQMFAAPERLRGERPDPRSDIYALAAILYCLCTGYVPVIDPDPPSKIVADIPWEWEQALLKALEKKPNKRHSSFGEFCDALNDSLPEIGDSSEFAESRTGPRRPTAMFGSVESSGGSGSASQAKSAAARPTRDEAAIRAEAECSANQREQREARAIERVPTGGLFPEADYHQRSERERQPSKLPKVIVERHRAKPVRKMPTSSNKKTTRSGVKRPILELQVTADDYHTYFGAKATGFFCPTNDPPNLGARLTVAVTVDGGEPIQIIGKVISRRLPSKDNRIPGGVGLTITPADRRRVEDALKIAGDERDRR